MQVLSFAPTEPRPATLQSKAGSLPPIRSAGSITIVQLAVRALVPTTTAKEISRSSFSCVFSWLLVDLTERELDPDNGLSEYLRARPPGGLNLAFAPTPEGLNPRSLEYSDGCFALGAVLVHGVDLWVSFRVSNIVDHYRGHLHHARGMVRIFHRRYLHLRLFRPSFFQLRHQVLHLS